VFDQLMLHVCFNFCVVVLSLSCDIMSSPLLVENMKPKNTVLLIKHSYVLFLLSFCLSFD
jgi:hypothetical protein